MRQFAIIFVAVLLAIVLAIPCGILLVLCAELFFWVGLIVLGAAFLTLPLWGILIVAIYVWKPKEKKAIPAKPVTAPPVQVSPRRTTNAL